MQRTIKILRLEDLPEDAELVQREIRKAAIACEIKTGDYRKSFENALHCFNPDIILPDNSLPFFNSFEALLLLQTSQIFVPFILVTKTVSEDLAVGIIKQGATDYILKDKFQRLLCAITKALENKKLEMEHQHFLQKIAGNETLMNDAQSLANFGQLVHQLHLWQGETIKGMFFYFRFYADTPPNIAITSKIKNQKMIPQFADNGKGFDLSKFGNKIFGLYQRFDYLVEGKGLRLFTVKHR